MSARMELDSRMKTLEDILGMPPYKDAGFGQHQATAAPTSGLQLLDAAIAQLEACLGLQPGQAVAVVANECGGRQGDRKTDGSKPAASSRSAMPGVTGDGQPEATMVDIRVGEIKKVWRHETADKLYCEEIDVGEAEPRQIASGLVPHYSLEEMSGRRVLVICNLKPRSLKGFKSQGMVVCAVRVEDGSEGFEKVELVTPPDAAEVGERLSFVGVEGGPFAPISAAQMEKKKVLDAVLPDLVTDEDGAVKWRDHPLVSSCGPCVAPTVRNGAVR